MAGLYIHTPFCTQKCAYCDFFSAPPQRGQLENWHRLIAQNLHLLATEQQPELSSIFFGGGTPSLLGSDQLGHILTCCQRLFAVADEAEISLEANPATLNPRRLADFRATGINRLSLGVQSFDDNNLKFLGRRHSAQQALEVIRTAQRTGFDSLSIDLIFALPQQTASDLKRDIDQLIALGIDHIGIYGLSIEPGTPLAQQLASGQLTEADEERYAELYLYLSQQLSQAGYEHYEISNFARPGHRCRHNFGYWARQAYLAAGAGAHGFEASNFGKRTLIPPDLTLYAAELAAGRNPATTLETFDREQAMAETIYLALRTADGIDPHRFAQRFGQTPQQAFPKAFAALAADLQILPKRISFNPEKWLIYDHLISQFL